jgi:biopolymer transport protein ExbD/biopolymer transport protein TolR
MCRFDLNSFSMVMVVLVFVVLVILMTSGPTGQRGAGVDLATARYSIARPRANREDAIIIAITRDGKVYVGSDQLFLPALPGLIHNRLADGAERKVYFEIDRNAKYGIVPPLLAKIRSAGVEDICFLVENYPPAPSGSAATKVPSNGPM